MTEFEEFTRRVSRLTPELSQEKAHYQLVTVIEQARSLMKLLNVRKDNSNG